MVRRNREKSASAAERQRGSERAPYSPGFSRFSRSGKRHGKLSEGILVRGVAPGPELVQVSGKGKAPVSRIAMGILSIVMQLATTNAQGGVGRGSARGETAEAVVRIEARQNVKTIEAWSGHIKLLDANALRLSSVNSAVTELQLRPSIAAPLLLGAFVDKSKERNFRINCAELVTQMGRRDFPEFDLDLIRVVDDKMEPPLIRIYAASLLLQGSPVHRKQMAQILDMAESLAGSGEETAFLRLFVIRHLRGEDRAVKFMLASLDQGAEVGPTLWVLGKLGGRQAIRPIEKMLNANVPNRQFPKTRAYLALGEIGGPEAYDILIRHLAQEQDETEQHMILRAIGASRDPRAKDFLVGYLNHKPLENYTSALRGLQYLGDPSVLLILEGQRSRPLEPYLEQFLQATITAIRDGKKTPEW